MTEVRDGVTTAFIITAVGFLVGVFWWYPNYNEWEQCGAVPGQAAFHAVTGKPSGMECLGTLLTPPQQQQQQQQPEPQESTPCGDTGAMCPYETPPPGQDCTPGQVPGPNGC